MKTFDLQDQQHQSSIIQDINNPIIMQKKEEQPMKKSMYVDIAEQPAGKGLRFRYECEGRSAGCIPGANTTNETKTYPTIKVVGYKGRAVVVVSCVTVEPPYRPHPHSLVGKEGCKKGVCTLELDPATMTCCFSSLGIQCVKRKEIESALQLRQQIRVDPFQTGFAHKDNLQTIDLNCVRLCFQVFLEGTEKGAFTFALRPVVSDPIYDKKSRSDLTICRMTECSASVTGGKEIMLFCDKVSKDDIQVQFYEETDGVVTWRALGEFQPTDVHKQYGICFRTPKYKVMEVSQSVKANIQLYRPSDGATSLPRNFYFLPIEGPSHSKPKRLKTDITEMLLDKRNLTTKVLNGGSIESPNLFYIANPNSLPTTPGGVGPRMIAMQSPITTPMSTTVIPSEFNNNTFSNPLFSTVSPVKFEPTMPIENNSLVSLNHHTPIVPPPGQHPYQTDTSSNVPPVAHALPMQVVQTTTINPNGISNEGRINQQMQYHAQIPPISSQQLLLSRSQQQQPELQNIQQVNPNPPMSIVTMNNWSADASRNTIAENVITEQQSVQVVQHDKSINEEVNSPTTEIDITELYDDVMQCVYDDVQADGDSIDLIFDKPPTPPERIRSSQIAVETSTILPEVIERALPEKPNKPSMMARFGRKGFLSGKGKEKIGKKKQDDVDSISKVSELVNMEQISTIPTTDAASSNKTNLPKTSSVPFFQRIFNRSKSQTEDELNFQNQLQRNSVIMSDSSNTDTAPNIPTHVGNYDGISDTATSGDGNETLKPNDTSISNENAMFDLLDEHLTVNELQT